MATVPCTKIVDRDSGSTLAVLAPRQYTDRIDNTVPRTKQEQQARERLASDKGTTFLQDKEANKDLYTFLDNFCSEHSLTLADCVKSTLQLATTGSGTAYVSFTTCIPAEKLEGRKLTQTMAMLRNQHKGNAAYTDARIEQIARATLYNAVSNAIALSIERGILQERMAEIRNRTARTTY